MPLESGYEHDGSWRERRNRRWVSKGTFKGACGVWKNKGDGIGEHKQGRGAWGSHGRGGGRGCHLDVCIKCVGSKNSTGALISLGLVLLKCGDIAGVGVGQAGNGDGHIPP